MGKKKKKTNIVNREIWCVKGTVYNGGEVWTEKFCEYINIRADIKNKRNVVLKRVAVRTEREHNFSEGALFFGNCKVFKKKKYTPKPNEPKPRSLDFGFED